MLASNRIDAAVGGIESRITATASRLCLPLDSILRRKNNKEAELGNPDAMGILGWMYQEGFGVEKDESKAKHYFDMERNTPPPVLPDDDTPTTPWMEKTVVEV